MITITNMMVWNYDIKFNKFKRVDIMFRNGSLNFTIITVSASLITQSEVS
jgi:hypothetical protein